MKRIIFAILFISAFSFSAMPGVALAKRHHRAHYVAHRVVYRNATPRSHGADLNGNVGIGLGPVHVGVGAGGGIHLHAFPPPKDPIIDPISANAGNSTMSIAEENNVAVSTGAPVLCPSLDPSSACDLNTSEVVTTSPVFIATAPKSMERFALSPDTNVNNYYATYAQPNVVTVGGFSVPVANDRMYFSPLRHRHGASWHVHNQKGVDPTADFGTSPRAGPLPESIGGTAYSITEQ